jgi:Family of unknown function (DUF6069)
MSTAQRASRLAGTRPAPQTVLPPRRRVLAAGLAAAAVSLAADAVLATIGQAAFTVPASFGKFAFGTYALLTLPGVAGATATWWALTRLSSRPKRLLTRLAALVTALLLIPDFLLLGTPGNPTGPVVVLMVMHLAVAAATYLALIRVAPARDEPTRPMAGSSRSSRPSAPSRPG